MNCAQHPDRASARLCTRCDRPICEDCTREHAGKTFCASCAEFLERRAASRPSRPRPGAAPQVAGDVPPLPADPGAGAGAGALPQVYEGPAPGPAGPAMSAASTGSAFASGDVYQGPMPGGVHQGAPGPGPGDVYQGPPPGDVYQGAPVATPAGPGAAAATAPAGETTLLRAGFFGLLGCALSVGLWYGIAMATGKELAIVALVLGLIVGFCTVVGAGRGGPGVALVSVVLFLLSMIWGEFLIVKKFSDDLAELDRQAATIEIDGRYTEEEARILTGYTEDEWGDLDAGERAMIEEEIEHEDRLALAEGWDPTEDAGIEEAPMTFGQFLSLLPLYLGFKGFLFLAIGAFEAWKIPMANA